MRRSTIVGTSVGLLWGALTVVATAAPAQAAPPVTQPDQVSLFAGNGELVDVLANDVDPEGDDLQVCRLGTEEYKRAEIFADPEGIFVLVDARSRPRSYTFTYYACDFEVLVPTTLTVTVRPTPDITVENVAGSPGRIRVTNPAPFKITFFYREPGSGQVADTRVRVPREGSVTLTVTARRIQWLALGRRGVYLAEGTLSGIPQP